VPASRVLRLPARGSGRRDDDHLDRAGAGRRFRICGSAVVQLGVQCCVRDRRAVTPTISQRSSRVSRCSSVQPRRRARRPQAELWTGPQRRRACSSGATVGGDIAGERRP
jgi:hypothetical protein